MVVGSSLFCPSPDSVCITLNLQRLLLCLCLRSELRLSVAALIALQEPSRYGWAGRTESA